MSVALGTQVRERSAASTALLRYDLVRAVLGLALMLAGLAKAYQLVAGLAPINALLNSEWLLGGAVAVELLFGAWLLAGLLPNWSRKAALVFFAALLAISLYQGFSAHESCGCFGAVRVSPWFAVLFDAAAVLALLLTRASQSPSTFRWSLLAPYVAGALVLLAGLTAWAFLRYGSVPIAMARLRGEAVIVEPPAVRLGDVGGGDHIHVSLRLRNLSDGPVTIVGGTHECSCNATGELPVTIPGRSARALQVGVTFPAQQGALARKVVFYSDYPKQRTVVGWVAARVVGPN